MRKTLPLDEMTVAEKLEALTAIWDSLLADEANINSPDWHKTELDARAAMLETGEAKFLSFASVKNNLLKRG